LRIFWKRAAPPGLVTFWRLYFDYVSTKVGQELSGECGRNPLAAFNDPECGEW
jgi:hypothetical protein